MTETVTLYDPSDRITYRHPGTSSRSAVRARLTHRRVVDSMTRSSYGVLSGRDPLTGERVNFAESHTMPVPIPSVVFAPFH